MKLINVERGTLFCEVANLEKAKIEVPVRDYELEDIRLGDRAILKLDAYPAATYDGKVEAISPAAGERVESIEGAFTMFKATVIVQNLEKHLLPGMAGEVKIVGQRRTLAARMAREVYRWLKFKIW